MTSAHTTTPRQLNAIIRLLAKDEAAVLAAATEAARTEPIESLTDRILHLETQREFQPFVTWLSRCAEDLLSPFHWLVYGARVDLGRETAVPTFEDLLRLIQLVRDKRPEFLPFTHRFITSSLLADVVHKAAPAPPATTYVLRTESSTSCLAVAQ